MSGSGALTSNQSRDSLVRTLTGQGYSGRPDPTVLMPSVASTSYSTPGETSLEPSMVAA
jgi:hypothetical protein